MVNPIKLLKSLYPITHISLPFCAVLARACRRCMCAAPRTPRARACSTCWATRRSPRCWTGAAITPFTTRPRWAAPTHWNTSWTLAAASSSSGTGQDKQDRMVDRLSNIQVGQDSGKDDQFPSRTGYWTNRTS